MQAVFSFSYYDDCVTKKSRLRVLREAAQLSQRELARLIDERQSNIQYWEETGKTPRSNVLIPMAKALGVTVEELLGETRARRAPAAGGRLGRLVNRVSSLPRRRQQKIIEVVEALVGHHSDAKDFSDSP